MTEEFFGIPIGMEVLRRNLFKEIHWDSNTQTRELLSFVFQQIANFYLRDLHGK